MSEGDADFLLMVVGMLLLIVAAVACGASEWGQILLNQPGG